MILLSMFLWTLCKLANMFDSGNETVIVTTEMLKILVSETELLLKAGASEDDRLSQKGKIGLSLSCISNEQVVRKSNVHYIE